jgi:hypothetical protein
LLTKLSDTTTNIVGLSASAEEELSWAANGIKDPTRRIDMKNVRKGRIGKNGF